MAIEDRNPCLPSAVAPEALVVTTRVCLRLLLVLTDSTVVYDFLFSFPFLPPQLNLVIRMASDLCPP